MFSVQSFSRPIDASIIDKSLLDNQQLAQFADKGYVLIDRLYPPDILTQLYAEAQQHYQQQHFKDAAIQNGVHHSIRRDKILWIDEDLSAAKRHIEVLQHLSQYLNRELFLGIREVEAHYACYQAGEFYGLHRDNPQRKNGRVISTVFYPHLHWQPEWGGQLRIQDHQGLWHAIEPLPNRLVLFQSDLLHEVCTTHHPRWSITAWLRQD